MSDPFECNTAGNSTREPRSADDAARTALAALARALGRQDARRLFAEGLRSGGGAPVQDAALAEQPRKRSARRNAAR